MRPAIRAVNARATPPRGRKDVHYHYYRNVWRAVKPRSRATFPIRKLRNIRHSGINRSGQRDGYLGSCNRLFRRPRLNIIAVTPRGGEETAKTKVHGKGDAYGRVMAAYVHARAHIGIAGKLFT